MADFLPQKFYFLTWMKEEIIQMCFPNLGFPKD